ncbi:basic blue protein-like [Phalaenopsis equestris]|uniref:basic blue protein-like n=1 Tax=Phalaenopsis equestris TaxID=78828 RepID=UPI0009E3DF29|nr:basic blue protein-like [Phalaenopsis equestris]
MVFALIFSNINLSVGHRKYTVGDDNGWDLNVITNWAKGKTFNAGDILEFKYNTAEHNVVVLKRRQDFENCNVASGSKIYDTGRDPIKLKRGYNYFICSKYNHCGGGLKMKIYAN